MSADDRANPALANSARADELGLDELLRMMDVATALRQERERAAAELDIDQLQDALRKRLRATADATGEQVTDAEIEVAIEQYYAQQHEFVPAERGWSRLFARLYVRRAPILSVTAGLLGAFLLTWWLVSSESSPFSAAGRAARKLAAAQEEARTIEQQVGALAAGDAAKAKVAELLAELQRARKAQNPAEIHVSVGKLRSLHQTLTQEYELRVVSRPGQRSAVFRNLDGELSGHYLIVEARTSSGQPVRVRIRNLENSRERVVSTWGEQVSEDVYNRLAADKRKDGIVDESLFARKLRGYLEPEIIMAGADGKTPLTRGRQITEW